MVEMKKFCVIADVDKKKVYPPSLRALFLRMFKRRQRPCNPRRRVQSHRCEHDNNLCSGEFGEMP